MCGTMWPSNTDDSTQSSHIQLMILEPISSYHLSVVLVEVDIIDSCNFHSICNFGSLLLSNAFFIGDEVGS